MLEEIEGEENGKTEETEEGEEDKGKGTHKKSKGQEDKGKESQSQKIDDTDPPVKVVKETEVISDDFQDHENRITDLENPQPEPEPIKPKSGVKTIFQLFKERNTDNGE